MGCSLHNRSAIAIAFSKLVRTLAMGLWEAMDMTAKLWPLSIGIALCMGFATPTVSAQGPELGISGTKVNFSAKEKARSITIRSGETESASFQIRAYRWVQQGDLDVLTPTDDIAVSPPMGTILPGKAQTVRIVLRNNDRSREQSYRILIDQIPSAGTRPAAREAGIAMNFRMSVPVFAATRSPAVSDVQWSFSREQDKFFIVAENRGGRHASISNLQVRSPQGQALEVVPTGLPYVLSGAVRRWQIIPPASGMASGEKLSITAQLDGVATERQLSVGGAP